MAYTIVCADNLDGVCAAAILSRYARLKSVPFKADVLDVDGLSSGFYAMESSHGNVFFILDINPEQVPLLADRLPKISANNIIAYWCFHTNHKKRTKEILAARTKVIDASGKEEESSSNEQRMCSAELAWKRFLPLDSVARALKDIAHDIEFWLRIDPRSSKLSDLLMSGIDKKHVIDALSKGVFWSDTWEKAHQEYLQKKEKALHDMMKGLVVKQYLTHRFGFVFAPSFLTSADAGQYMLDHHDGVDVAVVLFRNGSIFFRRREGVAVNLVHVAERFGGGGHAYASGGAVAGFPKVSHDNLDRARFAIDTKLKEYFFA